jgi:hypothetical protein
MAQAVTLTSITSDRFSFMEAMDSAHYGNWKHGMEEVCTSILLNDTFMTINSCEV